MNCDFIKNDKKLFKFLRIFFYTAYFLGLLIILWYCIRHPNDGLTTKDVTSYSLLFLAFPVVLTFVLFHPEKFLAKYSKFIFPCFLIVYGIFLYWLFRNVYGQAFGDQRNVLDLALDLGGYGESDSWTYIARFRNNAFSVIYLGALFRICHMLGLNDVYNFSIFFNVIQILLALWAVYDLGHYSKKHPECVGWTAVLLIATFFPVYTHMQSLYTDAFSFCWGVLATAVWMRLYTKSDRKIKFIIGNICAALFWIIGASFKFTVLISFIALMIASIFFLSRKDILRNLVFGLLPIIVGLTILNSVYDLLPIGEYRDSWRYPGFSYFIAIGLKGDGSFTSGEEYFYSVGGIYGYEAKQEFTKRYIADNIDAFWNKDHLVAKAVYNFSSGEMMGRDFLWNNFGPIKLSDIVTGSRAKEYRSRITNYWFVLLGIMTLGVAMMAGKEIRGFKDFDPRSKEDFLRFVIVLTMAGLMLYLMLGEANNRQLFNHVPWFMLCVSYTMCDIIASFKPGKKLNAEEN